MFLRHFADEKTGVPYGIALGIGGLLTYPDSPVDGLGAGRLAGELIYSVAQVRLAGRLVSEPPRAFAVAARCRS